MFIAKARLLAITLWAGSLWTVGYLVAPTLFATLDKVQAGSIAGSMLRSEAGLSMLMVLVVGGLLVASSDVTAQRRKSLLMIVGAMLVCVLVNYVGLWPVMADAKLAGDRATFGMLHGVSMVVYLLQSILAAVLVLKNP